MMLDEVTDLLVQNQVATFTTYRRDGRPQMSLVTVGRVGDALAFTTHRPSAKYANLLRDPRCAMMVMSPDLRNYAVLDGDARMVGGRDTDPETVRLILRDVYRAAARKEHPDWEEYDRAMREQDGVVVLIIPDRIYGKLG